MAQDNGPEPKSRRGCSDQDRPGTPMGELLRRYWCLTVGVNGL
jgi:hypothetical protein